MPMMRDSSVAKLLLFIAAVALSTYRPTTTMAFTLTRSSITIKQYHSKKCIYHHHTTQRPHQRHDEDSRLVCHGQHMRISSCMKRPAMTMMIVEASSSSSNENFNDGNKHNDNMESSYTDDNGSKDIALLLDQTIIMQENPHEEEEDESSGQQQHHHHGQEIRKNKVVVTNVVVHQHQQIQIVAKSLQSFKLADLYWLESCVISHYTTTSSINTTHCHAQQKVESLAFHHPTASHLLSFWTNTAHASNYDTTTTATTTTDTIVVKEDRQYYYITPLPFRSKRIQYIAEILASGYTPLQLIDNINSGGCRMILRKKGIKSSLLWTLEYDIFERWHNNNYNVVNNNNNNTNNNNYNQNHSDKVCSTMLLCAVSRALPGEPSLSLTTSSTSSSTSSSILQEDNYYEVGSSSSITPYIIIETCNQFYLARKLSVKQSTVPTLDRVDFDLKQQQQQRQHHTNSTDQFQSLWSKRPFQYSGAINIGVASVIIDMLSDALQLSCHERHQSTTTTSSSSSKQRIIRILDPTCGSGTFLALALMIWSGKYSTTVATATATDSSSRYDTITVEATGIDSNYKCARGTLANLKHLFGVSTGYDDDDDDEISYNVDNNVDDDVIRQWTLNLYPTTGGIPSSSLLSSSALPSLSRVTIHANDSVNLSTFILDKFDCAVANLPWNRNTFEYQGHMTNNDTTSNTSTSCCTNEHILLSTAAVLKPGAPLVIVSNRCSSSNNTRQDTQSKYTTFNVKECLESMGFVILGQATIPPRGFQLPLSGKKKKKINTKKDAPILIAMKNENVQRSSDCLITVAIAPG